jgi:hypothetical protein
LVRKKTQLAMDIGKIFAPGSAGTDRTASEARAFHLEKAFIVLFSMHTLRNKGSLKNPLEVFSPTQIKNPKRCFIIVKTFWV